MYHRVIDVISLRKRREVLKEKQEKLKSFRCSDSRVMFFFIFFSTSFFFYFLLLFLARILFFSSRYSASITRPYSWSSLSRAFAKEKCSSLDVKKVLLILCQLVPFKLNRLHRLLLRTAPLPVSRSGSLRFSYI